MCLIFEILLKQLPPGVIKHDDASKMDFIQSYVQKSSLFGHEAWDDRFTTIVSAELQFYFLHRDVFFSNEQS